MTDSPRDHDPVDILIVDDRNENLLAVEAILEPLGENAHPAEFKAVRLA